MQLAELATRTNPALATTVRVRSGFLCVVSYKMQMESTMERMDAILFSPRNQSILGPGCRSSALSKDDTEYHYLYRRKHRLLNKDMSTLGEKVTPGQASVAPVN